MIIERSAMRGLAAIAVIGVVLGGSGTAQANNHEKYYADGPLTAGDFEGAPPATLPTEHGVELKAQTAVGTSFSTEAPPATTEGGKKVVTPDTVKVETFVDKSQSWNTDKTNTDLLDHEQGHVDIEEAAARAAQAEINQKIKDGSLKGSGDTEAQAQEDLENKIQAIIDKHLDEKHEKYDVATEHGTAAAEQKKARDEQRAALKDPNTKKKKKKGATAKSKTTQSIGFDAASGILSIDQDFITGIDPNGGGFIVDPGDPILGAEVVLPSFELVGETSAGDFFFSAVGTNPLAELVAGGTALFSSTLDYMLYDPLLNQFYGIGMSFEALGASTYVLELVENLTAGPLSLFGIELFPDADFAAITQGFTVSATSTGTNGLGARIVTTPEPAALSVLLTALAAIGANRCRRRRLVRGGVVARGG